MTKISVEVIEEDNVRDFERKCNEVYEFDDTVIVSTTYQVYENSIGQMIYVAFINLKEAPIGPDTPDTNVNTQTSKKGK